MVPVLTKGKDMRDGVGILRILFIVLLVAGLSSCLKFDKPSPDKNYFALSVSRSGPAAKQPLLSTLRVQRFLVSPRYNNRAFVYRSGDLNYESDFYNAFFLQPGVMFSEETARWLDQTGIFQQVMLSSTQVAAEYVLEGYVDALYGDYRDDRVPKAVLSMTLSIVNDRAVPPKMVIRKQYSREIPLTLQNPDILAKGWNEGLKHILTQFENVLKNISF